MELSEMFDMVLLDSGQFMLPVEKVELDKDKFLILVKQALAIYNRNCPYTKRFNLWLTQRHYEFTAGTTDSLGNLIGIPEQITDLTPVRISGVSPFFLREFEQNKSPDLIDKIQWPIQYRKPILFVPIMGLYDLEAMFYHEIREHYIDDQTKGYYVDTIDYSHLAFFKFLRAKFMKALAASRKAFTLRDLPITSDASEMYSAGDELEKEAMEMITGPEQKWFLAIK